MVKFDLQSNLVSNISWAFIGLPCICEVNWVSSNMFLDASASYNKEARIRLFSE
jgi:hypothetical protein